MAFRVGSQVGPYRIVGRLGAGGMGEVLRARDARLERDVALKVLPEHLGRDDRALSRFETEARLLAALSDPHIVSIFDVGRHEGTSYVVLELLEGRTLRQLLSGEALAWEEAVEIGLGVAAGLEAAHAKGVIHGDLKPENVLLTDAGLVKLLDFGLARLDVEPTRNPEQATTIMALPEGIAGTVPYMSPEQVRGETLGTRSDVFSFGCLLGEMLTGAPPFAGDSQAEILAAILRDPPAEGPALQAVPASLVQILRRCLQKRPGDRIGSMAEVRVALSAAQAGHAAEAAVVSTPDVGSRRRSRDSIAILPFATPATEDDTTRWCEGLTGRIIDTLSSCLPGLRVMAWATVERYRGTRVDPRLVGRELGVRVVLSGRLEQAREGSILHLELADGRDGARLWGRSYVCDPADLLRLQEQLTSDLTQELQPEQRREVALPRPTQNPEAYRLYLQGRFYWNKRSRDGLLRSLELFEQCSQLDARFALAHAGLADAYALLGGFGYLPAAEAYTKARQEAERALALDATLAEAHAALATVRYRHDWDWRGAQDAFEKALDIHPGYANAHLWYGVYLTLMRRFEAGARHVLQALELDPLSLVANWTRGYTLYYERRFDEALQQYRRTLGIDPTFARVHVDVGLISVLMGRHQEGIGEIQKAMALLEDSPGLLASLGYAYAVAGDRAEATRILAELERIAKRRPLSRFTIALVHVGLGDKDAAFRCLDQALRQREDALVSLQVNPRLDPLRSDRRYTRLMQRVGLPQ